MEPESRSDSAAAARETFGSGWGAVLTTAGVAIGLGNVWRFPYMMGLYGGTTFLLVYLAIVVAFGIPALSCEWALGRATGSGPLGAFRRVGLPGGRFWGALLLVTVTLAASYYGVVVAWVLDFAVALAGGGVGEGSALFPALLASPGRQLAFLAVTVTVAAVALASGVRRGIERVSRAVLPIFFVLFAALTVRVLTLPGALEALAGYLTPRWELLSGEVVLAALGQAFFSLALGGTFMVIYGSYLDRRQRLTGEAVATAATDVAAALLAGLLVVPAVLAVGLDMASGPSLMFEVMPEVFARMPGGGLFGTVFFLAIFLVALLSLMAAYEVIVGALTDHLGWSRRRAVWTVAGGEVVLGVPALFSLDYLEWSDFLWGSTMQPLGGALAVIAFLWSAGRARALEEIGPAAAPRPLYLWVKWVVPGGILATLAYGWWERLAGG